MYGMISDFLLASVIGLLFSALFFAIKELQAAGARASIDFSLAAPVPSRSLVLLASSIPQLPVEVNRIRRDVARAGFYDELAPLRILAWRNLFVWSCLTVTVVLVLNIQSNSVLFAVLGILASLVFYAIPGVWLNARGNRRAEHIVSSVPEILDLLSMSLAGGLTLEQSLEKVSDYSQNISKDMDRELKLVLKQARVSSVGSAFQMMANRFDEAELRSLAMSILRSEKLGVDLRRSIDALSESVRRTLRASAEARANSQSMKILFPVIFLLVPPVFFVLVLPPILEMKNHFDREVLSPEVREILNM